MSTTRLVYAARQNAESGAQVLANLYHFILHCAIESYETEKAAEESDGQDARKEISNGSGKSILR